MNKIFDAPVNIRYGLPKNTVYAWIKVGDDPANRYLIINETRGLQIFRTQYDVAVDGTRYMLTAGRGRGGFTFTVLEGPLVNCDGSETTTFASKYGDLDKYKKRTVDVVLGLEASDSNTGKNTKNAAHFSGVITQAETSRAIGSGAEVLTQTTINSEGMWK